MENENEGADVEVEVEDTESEENAEVKNKEEEHKEGDKKLETPEARKARLERQLKKVNKELGIDPEEKKDKKTEGGLDLTQESYLIANGIKEDDEMELVATMMKDTGKDIKTLIKSDYFKSELKTLRETNAAKDAIPDGSRRGTNLARNSVEYWVAKGELPPNTPENQKLRSDVVNAKMKKSGSGSNFTQHPVVK